MSSNSGHQIKGSQPFKSEEAPARKRDLKFREKQDRCSDKAASASANDSQDLSSILSGRDRVLGPHIEIEKCVEDYRGISE